MTTQESVQDFWGGPAGRQPHDKAYFLDLLGDSHTGLGCHEAAIEAYRQAAERFKSQEAHCSYALCLFKVAGSHLSLGEPWHALGYLEACLPLLHELGLTRHETLARELLAQCQSELAGARLLTGANEPKQCRRISATRVDSCYARDRRTDALAERRRTAGVARHRPPVPAAHAPARP